MLAMLPCAYLEPLHLGRVGAAHLVALVAGRLLRLVQGPLRLGQRGLVLRGGCLARLLQQGDLLSGSGGAGLGLGCSEKKIIGTSSVEDYMCQMIFYSP